MGSCKFYVLGDLISDAEVVGATKELSDSVVFIQKAEPLPSDEEDILCVYILGEFEGPLFDCLSHRKSRILGRTALLQLVSDRECISLQKLRRPLFCQALHDVTVCFTGFRDREELSQLSQYIFYMGGRVRREMEYTTTHLIAHHPGGEKFKYADTFGIPVMASSWVISAWDYRHQTDFSATSPEHVSKHKLKLGGQHVCFLGFPAEETDYMNKILVENNGVTSNVDDPLITHLVLDEINSPPIPENLPNTCYVVKAVWFWASVQNETCAQVDDYLLKDSVLDNERVTHTPGSAAARARKRKRQQQLAARLSASPAECKRRSSINGLDNSSSYLDWTLTPEKDQKGDEKPQKDTKPLSGRQQKFLELVHTESNYVKILNVIVNSFKVPLEQMAEKGNPILDAMELKMIFGNLPPILEIHSAMLAELKAGEASWTPTYSIGQVILSKAGDLQKAYPPFINSYERSKESLENCEAMNSRFHAFLKIRQSQPDCGRQTLKELMIRPVQRLPSVILLLTDLLKQTEKSHPDYSPLESALSAVKEAMTHINEDKRRAETQLALYELFNEIENCPPDLISSHRCLVTKAECVDLSDGRPGEAVTFILFTDTIEICCKRRGKTLVTLRGAKPRSLQKCNKSKPYKHLRLIPLSSIRRVCDVRDPYDRECMFSLLVHNSDTLQQGYTTFSICDDTDKTKLLGTLCQQLARIHCTADPEMFFDELDSHELGLEQKATSQFTTKALKFATTAKAKMGRALSLNRTPSRASRIMPRRAAEAPSPAVNQLAQMRLQSCANLNELGRDSTGRRPSLPSGQSMPFL